MTNLNKKSILEWLVAGLLGVLGGTWFLILRDFQSTYQYLIIIRYIIIFACFSASPLINKKFSETKYYKFIIMFLIILIIISSVIEYRI